MKTKTAMICFAIAAGGSASAQAAQTWNVTLPNAATASLVCADATKPDTCLSGSGKTNVFDDGATITITCPDAATCSKISLSRDRRRHAGLRGTGTSKSKPHAHYQGVHTDEPAPRRFHQCRRVFQSDIADELHARAGICRRRCANTTGKFIRAVDLGRQIDPHGRLPRGGFRHLQRYAR